MQYKSELTLLGSFSITGEMRVSDPCYAPDVWCSGVLNTVPGTWEAGILISDENGWGNRVAVLAAKHEECSLPLETRSINDTVLGLFNGLPPQGWHIADFEVGVDSGQAGFFDNENFVARNGGHNDAWYSQMCDITLSRAQAGTFSDGVVTRSGFGDGGYSCAYHTSADGKADFVYIVFIYDDEE